MDLSKRVWKPGWIRLASCALVLTWLALPVSAYNSEVHRDLYDLAFPEASASERQVAPPSPADLAAFRAFVYRLANADPGFRERWPAETDFTAYAFKEFLALNPLRRVIGIDFVPGERPLDVRSVVRGGSTDPDTDRRNQDRLFVRPDGTVVLDPSGRAVPADPRTVWFGGLVGAASQFDAHGAMLRTGEKGGWMLTTLGRPEQYARPKVSLGSAPEFSESYAQLAMLARLWGGEGGPWLAMTFAGNSLHGIEDMGNQIHATLIGTHRFYLDTLLAWVSTRFRPLRETQDADSSEFSPLERLSTDELIPALELLGNPEAIDPGIRFALGLEPTGNPGVTELALRILGSHHRLLEAYFQEFYVESRDHIRAGAPERALPAVADLIRRAEAGDEAFRLAAQARLEEAGLGQSPPGSTAFAKILAETLLVYSAPEAKSLYNAIRAMAIKPLHSGRQLYHDGQPPLDFIRVEYREAGGDDPHSRAIWELSAGSIARVVTAVRLWFEIFERETGDVSPGSPEALTRARLVAGRLAAGQLLALEQAEQRRAEYLKEQGLD